MGEARTSLAAADVADVAKRITAVLTADPRVARARVTLEPDEATGRLTPLGWIVPASDWIVPARRRAQARQSGLAVKLWARVFDTAYFAGESSAAGPSYAGWTSSLTGAPIPAAEMDLWRDHTVARIRALQPRHVLEIGCGLGLLLERIAPDCESYRATDISAEAIDRLRAWAAGQHRLRHVELAQRAAHELDDLPPGSVDTVIINSVVQYFPDSDYLSQVLAAVARLLSPGGQVFVGDLRDVRLLEPFNAAVALAGAAQTATAGSLRRALHTRAETELAVDPLGLAATACHLAGYSGARLLLKQHGGDNEMTRYRVDVVLRGGPARPAEVPAIPERAWDAAADSAATLPIRAPADRTPLLLRDILNARLAADLVAARLIGTAPADTPVASLRAAIAASRPTGQDPAELVRQAERCGHRAEAICSAAPERFDLLLSDPAIPPPELPVAADGAAVPASDPLLARLAAPLLAELAEALADGVPGCGAVTLAAVPALPALG